MAELWENKYMLDRYKTRPSFATNRLQRLLLPPPLLILGFYFSHDMTVTSLLEYKLFTRQIVYISNIPCRRLPHNHILPTRSRPRTSVASVGFNPGPPPWGHSCPCRCTTATSAVLVVSGWYWDVICSQSATTDGTTELDTDTTLDPLCKTALFHRLVVVAVVVAKGVQLLLKKDDAHSGYTR